jgi:hypothetical protein
LTKENLNLSLKCAANAVVEADLVLAVLDASDVVVLAG